MKRYVNLNKSYSVRNDCNGSYLIRKEGVNNSYNGPSIVAIPPFVGYIFANIGKKPLEIAIRDISSETNISEKAILHFIERLLTSEFNLSMKLNDGQSVVFPNRILEYSNISDETSYFQEDGFSFLQSYADARPTMPVNVNLMTTTKCTTNCLYCYADRTLDNTLDKNELINILTELKQGGAVNVMLTGGDLFAFPDWKDVLTAVMGLGYTQALSTKTPLSIDDLRWLKDNGCSEMQFSLDSSNPFVISKMLGVNGDKYLNKAISFLENCSNLNLDIHIRTVVTSLNSEIEEIKELYSFITSFKCIKGWAITPMFYSEYRKSETLAYATPNNHLEAIYKFVKTPNMKFHVSLNKITEVGYQQKRHETVEDFVENNMTCLANYTTLSILANGHCSVCEMLYDKEDYHLGDVRTLSIREIWNSDKALELYSMNQANVHSSSACGRCQVFSKCRNKPKKRVCYSNILRSGKKPFEPDPSCPMAEQTSLIL